MDDSALVSRSALERLMIAVRSCGFHQDDRVLPAYRYCVDLLGYDPWKRDPSMNVVVSSAPASCTSTTLGPGGIYVDFFCLLNPEE